jgi:hypothetical protein
MANDAKRRTRFKGRGGEHSYLGIPHYILRSQEFGRLRGWQIKLLIELGASYNGRNNGDLSAAFKQLRARGWKSAGTLNATIKELVQAGWIVYSRHGGRNRCALFAITWWPVDECEGKGLEIKPEAIARHTWKTESVVGIRTNVVAERTNRPEEMAA